MHWNFESNRIFVTDEASRLLAEITFPPIGDNLVEIYHTFVSPVLRGQGMAGQLVEKAACQIRDTGRRCRVSCSYAVQWLQRHPEWAGIVEPA